VEGFRCRSSLGRLIEEYPGQVPRGGQGGREHEDHGNQRGPGIPGLSGLDDDGRSHAEGDRGKELVGDAEHGPDRGDVP